MKASLHAPFRNAAFLTGIFIFCLNIHASAQQHQSRFLKIFDGKTLEGWKGDTSHWFVQNGNIVGLVTPEKPLKNNTFLIWQGGEPGDFELTAEFRISKGGNSGINYRSEPVERIPNALKGYQADIDGENVYTGQNYEERGRAFLAKRGEKVVIETGKPPAVIGLIGNGDTLKKLIRQEKWNSIRIVAKGNNMKHYINGILMCEVTDNDTANRKAKGLLGLQAHVTPSMKVEYRKLFMKKL